MFEQVKLSYEMSALEPVIDQATMETHYGKHHAAYTKAFNDLAEKAGLAGKSAEEILSGLSSVEDEALRNGLRNQGGGYLNHNLYFEQLAPETEAAKEPTGALADAVKEAFGDLETLQTKLSACAAGQFGSGWGWLVADKDGKLSLMPTANQDNPYSLGCELRPILLIDVWEHAYYLKYRNLRADYVKEIWRVIDWKVAERRYAAQ
jgi:Fe-Mn family superoxide dismutase